MKYFIVILCFFFAVAVAADITEPDLLPANNKPHTAEVLKGTVVHVFEDFVSVNNSVQHLAKVRLNNQTDTKENLVIVEIPASASVTQGDRVLVNKVENSETFGMGDSFDLSYVFRDFARDYFVIIVLASFMLLLFFINKASLYPALLVAANLFLLGVILPLALQINHPIIPWLFLGLFIAANSGLLWYVLPSKKFKIALGSTVASTTLLMVSYTLFANWAHVTEYAYLQKILPGTLSQGLLPIDALALAIAHFFLTFYVTLFLVRVSYVHTIYDNVKILTFRVFFIYFLIAAGLLLPTYVYAMANDIGLSALCNCMPFVFILMKLSFMFWGTLSAVLLYLFFFYINNKQYFQKHIHIPAAGTLKQIDVQRILSDQKANAYTAIVSPKKKKRTISVKKKKK